MLISVVSLWDELFAIKIYRFFRRFSNFAFSWIWKNFDKIDNIDKIDWFQSWIARLMDIPQKWVCTFWNRQGKAIPKSLWAKQFAIKHRQILHLIFEGGLGVSPKSLKTQNGFKSCQIYSKEKSRTFVTLLFTIME